MNMIGSFFHPEQAYKNAMNESQQGWNEAQGYQRPFWQQGQDQYGRLNQATGDLLNPQELENKWASSYENSPYAKQLLAQNQSSGLDAASSMGLMGSSAALGNIQQGAGNIVNQDRQQYLNDLMQKYMSGIGLGQSLYGTGAQAGANLGSQAQKQGENQAGLAYGRQAAPGQLFGQIAGAGINAATGGLSNLANAGRFSPFFNDLFKSQNQYNANSSGGH